MITNAAPYPESSHYRTFQQMEAEIIRLKYQIGRLEEKYRFLEEKSSKAFYNNQIPMTITTLDYGVFIDVNQCYLKILEYNEEDLIGRSSVEVGIWPTAEERQAMVDQLSSDGYIRDKEFQFRKKTGEICYALFSGSLMEIDDDKYLLASWVDITPRHLIREQLETANEKFSRSFHENQTSMIITAFEDGICVDVNDAFCRSAGYRREEMISKSVAELGIWVDQEHRRAWMQELETTGYSRNQEYPFRRKNGKIGYRLSSSSLIEIKGVKYVITSSNDITERKQLEDSLLLANDKFSKAFYDNQTPMIITSLDKGMFIEGNDSLFETLGYSRDDITGKSVIELGVWSSLQDRQDVIREIAANQNVRTQPCTMCRKSGEVFDTLLSSSMIEIDGEACALTSIIDITQLKKAQQALSRSKKLFYQMFDHMPLPIIIVSIDDGRIIEVNDPFLRFHNLARENFKQVNDNALEYWPGKNEFLAELVGHHLLQDWETSYQLKNGEKKTVILSGVIVDWEGFECALCIVTDITDIKNYQKEMARLSNMNIIGNMAASIAHEIRNPMTTIRGYLQLFQGEAQYAEDSEAMELMIEELDRVNEIISAFLSLAQKNVIEVRQQDLNSTIMNLLPVIMADAIKNDVAVKIDLRDISPIMFDEAELHQVLLNLVRNGIESMSGEGTLTIKTYEDEPGINMVVEDQGCGIPVEISEKIGTPFITTKDNSSGLGLAVCYSIAQRHGAEISFVTNPTGSAFTVTFPAAG